MEVQGLQEALQVEIQCHQNPTLCKGLNELQNGQKMAVRSCPVGATKPLTLIKPTSQGIAISVVPAPVAAVTAHINGQKTPGSDPPQTLPANLQTGGRVAFGVGGRPLGGKRALELPPAQMLGSLTSVPIKVPQVSSLHRLAGQAAGVLPQVRPKTLIPDSLPHSPCPDPPQPRTTSALNHPGPTLPTPNCTLSPHRQPYDGAGEAGGPAQHASAGAGVAYAIIAASPANGNGVAAVGEAVKVIIIQPQAPGSSEGGSLPLPSQEPPPAPTKKIDEDPEKIAFMVSLGLVTNEHLEGLGCRLCLSPAQTSGDALPEQPALLVGTRMTWSRTSAAPCAARTVSCSRVTTAREPSTGTACSRRSRPRPGDPGTAPSAARRF